MKRFPTIELINISITSPIYPFVCVRTFKFYCLSKFQLHSTVLSITVIMLHFRPSELIHHINLKCVPFTNISYFLTPSPGNHHSILHLFELNFCLDSHVSDTMQYLSFSVWLISVSVMPSSFIYVV